MTRITFKHMVLSGLLAGIAATSLAQPAPTAPAAPPTAQAGEQRGARQAMHRPDPAKLQARIAERQAALKAQLQITPAQEPAWSAFTASAQPQARPPRPDREALRSMTTPERIHHMRTMQAERQAAMDRRADATLRLYAALTPEQQKLFDTQAGPHAGGRGDHGLHGRHAAPAKG